MTRFTRFRPIVAACLVAMAAMLCSAPAQAQLFRGLLAQADVAPIAPPADAPAPAAPTDPAAPAAQGDLLKIQLSATQGNVQVRMTEADAWQPAKVGMELTIGAEIRTGLRSLCQFTIDGNHTITLDRLGVVKVLDAIKKDGKVKTDVGMKYGRTQYKVEANAAEHEAMVHAPSATLAVRGSLVTLEDNDAFGSTAIVDHSENAIYKQRGPDGSVRVVSIELIKGRIEQGKEDAGKNPPTPAELALRDTINDVGTRLARASDLERDLVAQYPIFNGADSNGGGSIQDIQDQLTDTIFPIDSEGSFLSGGLSIEASWVASQNLILFATEPSSAGGKIISIPGNFFPGSENFTQSVRPSGPAPGFAGTATNQAGIFYSEGVPGGSWGIGMALTDTETDETISFTVNIFRTPVSEGSPQLISVFSGVLGVTGPSETTTKITTSFNVGAPPPPGSSD